MLYYLDRLSEHATSDFFKAFNVFQYVTFRAVGAALTAFVLSLAFGNFTIRKLLSLKLGQPIRNADEVHKLAELHGQKAGTPTMGGILLLGTTVLSTLLWARPDNSFVWLVLGAMLAAGALGFADDYLKVSKKNSAGVRERTKILVQLLIALGVTYFFLTDPRLQRQASALYVPFYKKMLIPNMGIIVTFLFFAGIILGTSNAVNLTDGLDGLATGCTLTVTFAYSVLAYVAGHHVIAKYLEVPFYPQAAELTVFCMALAGASLGFLWFNAHPAKMFMGDTGSLAIGGAIGVVAICVKQELLLVVIGFVFVVEASSVLIQRFYFKFTKRKYGQGRRVFRMAPLHHHFELSGINETVVVTRFWIVSFICALLGLATLKLR
ncbi:phospho-N-acetylmuramoyl-pentapeptide-transferase [Verrucomicrobiota bacterium]|jgi:phospho-N-acetylmuramoyl-pentapeptide-transferase|nr:phospho-N-acetylmuramoyl-pentapeptide-transferase [Verrucomicrobiota bacterium]